MDSTVMAALGFQAGNDVTWRDDCGGHADLQLNGCFHCLHLIFAIRIFLCDYLGFAGRRPFGCVRDCST